MTNAKTRETILLEAKEEHIALLNAIGDRSVSAASLTRQLYPDAFVPSPEYQHIRYRLNEMVKRGELLCNDPLPEQERLYWKNNMEKLLWINGNH